MDTAFLLSLQQLVLSETPLTTSEAREMFLRHVSSDPSSHRKNPLTQVLACLYEELYLLEFGQHPTMIHGTKVRALFRESFVEGFTHILPGANPDIHVQYPSSLLWTDRDYPRELIEQLGVVLGYQAAKSIS